jgi:uncharacterized RDD family membrane protein YckC
MTRNRRSDGARDSDKGHVDEEFGLEIPDTLVDVSLWKRLSLFQLLYSVGGLLLAAFCMFSGVLLCIRGASGSSNFTAALLGANTAINDAAPGVVLFVVGLLVVWITRMSIRTTNSQGKGRGPHGSGRA